MADTPAFQFDTQSGIVGANNNPIPVPQVGINGGRNVPLQGPQHFSSGDSVDSTFPSFLAAAFAPKLQAAQQEQFWQGFTAARTGESMQDIHDEQPWYSKIFGPTNFEMGAQTFAVQKASADVEQQFNEQMPDLRQQDSGTVAKHLSDIAQGAMTGDQYTDALIQKELMARSGPMMDAHAKQHYAWQQETLAKDQHGAMMSAASALQAALSNQAGLGTEHPDQQLTPEQMAETKRNFINVFQPPRTQDPTSYMKNVLASVDQMAQQGQFYAVNTLRQAGLFNSLTPDMQDQLDKRIDRARSNWQRNQAAGPLLEQIVMLNAQAHAGQISAKAVTEGYESINKQYMATTGDDQPLFDQKDITSPAASAADAVFRANERLQNKQDELNAKAQTQAEKQAAKDKDAADTVVAVQSLQAGQTKNIGKSQEDVEQGMDAVIAANPQDFNRVVVGNLSAAAQPFKSERLAQRIQSQVANTAGEEYNAGFENAYQTWKGLMTYTQQTPSGPDTTSGPNAAVEYFGPFAKRMDLYDKAVGAGVPKEVAYRSTFGAAASEGLRAPSPGTTAQQQTKLKTDFNSAVNDYGPSWWNPLSGPSLGNAGRELLSQATAPFYQARVDMGWSNKDAAQGAIQAAQANGFERGGQYAWQNLKNQKSVAAIAGMAQGNGEGTDTFSKSFDSLLSGKFRAQGLSVNGNSSITVVRLSDDPDPKVGARLVAVGYDPDSGTMKQVNLTTKDLLTLRDQQAAQARADAESERKLSNQPHFFGQARGQ